MKRIPLYIIILTLVFFAPVRRVNVGTLRPVEVVSVYRLNGKVIIETDTGDLGQGIDMEQAVQDMKQTSPAVIYLDTAEYLLFTNDCQYVAQELRSHLKGSVKVCMTQGQVSTKDAAKYLVVHGDLPKLKHWKPGDKLPVLTEEKLIEK